MTKNDGLIPGAEAGYFYDWTRQHQNEDFENKKKCKKLKKRMNKLTKRNKILRHK